MSVMPQLESELLPNDNRAKRMEESMRVLVIEDDREAAEFLTKGLRESGYVVVDTDEAEQWAGHRLTPTPLVA